MLRDVLKQVRAQVNIFIFLSLLKKVLTPLRFPQATLKPLGIPWNTFKTTKNASVTPETALNKFFLNALEVP